MELSSFFLLTREKNRIDLKKNGARKELTAEPYEAGNSQVRF